MSTLLCTSFDFYIEFIIPACRFVIPHQYTKNILNDDSITPEYIEKLSNKFFKLANEMRSKDNDDNGNDNDDDNDDNDDNGNDDNDDNDDNGNDNGNINNNSKKGSGMFTSQKEFAKL